MSIATGILADGPLLYWKLDDAAGPVADSSGHGVTGTPTAGLISYRQPGPEAGTFAISMSGSTSIQTTGQSPVLASPYTMVGWVAPVLNPTVNSVFLYNGNTGLRGSGIALNATPPASQIVSPLSGGGAFGAAGGTLLSSRYHQFAYSISAASNKIVYIDGAPVISAVAVPTNPLAAGDKFLIGSGASCFYYFAHVALYGSVLSGAQIATQFNANGGLIPPPFSNPPIGALDFAAMTATLNAILASVRKTY